MAVRLGRPGEEVGIHDIDGLRKAARKFEPRAFRVMIREQSRERAEAEREAVTQAEVTEEES